MQARRTRALLLVTVVSCTTAHATVSGNLIRDGDFECDFATIRDINDSWTIDVSVDGEKIAFTMPAHSIAFIQLWKGATDEQRVTAAGSAVDAGNEDTPAAKAHPAREVDDAGRADGAGAGDERAPSKPERDDMAMWLVAGAVLILLATLAAVRFVAGSRRRKRDRPTRGTRGG